MFEENFTDFQGHRFGIVSFGTCIKDGKKSVRLAKISLKFDQFPLHELQFHLICLFYLILLHWYFCAKIYL